MESPVVIIGAGPAGLAMAALLRQEGISFDWLEKSQRVGNAWHFHYDRLHLHTVKELSHLPGLPFPKDYPRYVSRDQLCRYMETYARHFDLQPRFGEEVVRVKKAGGAWEVECRSGSRIKAGAVVFATGVNRVPNRPDLPGEERFQGQILHSAAYRRPDPFLGKEVLVVGMGNTGAEVALDLAESGIRPFLSVRGPVNIVPRDAFGRPTQLTARKLARLPDWLADWIGKQVQKITVGRLDRFGLRTADLAPARQLREQGKTPVIDLGTVDMIRRGRIRVCPGIRQLEEREVHFTDGTRHAFDAIILCTGYRPRLDAFLPGIKDALDPNGCPTGWEGTGPEKGLFFLGFDNYTPGGILGTINRDAPLIAEAIARQLTSRGTLTVPSDG